MAENDLITLRRIFVGEETGTFSLQDLKDFPYSKWQEKKKGYEKQERWYSGKALEEQLREDGTKTNIYPVRINPIRGAVLKHAAALFGEFPEDAIGPLVRFRVLPNKDDQKETAQKAEEVLNNVWWESLGGSAMLENGIISQKHGGCVFKVSYQPLEFGRTIPVAVEKIEPDEFYAIPEENNPWMLKKAWVIRKIDADTAEEYGIPNIGQSEFWYIEYWDKDTYFIKINDSSLGYQLSDRNIVLDQKNPFGFVPFVYIPHERAGGFWGDSLITDAAKGLTRELNSRVADLGDATNDETHGTIVGINLRATPKFQKLATGFEFLNIGGSAGISANEQPPDMKPVVRASVSSAMIQLTNELQVYLQRELRVPAVAYGEDEGSQRSALTLVTRMWPLVSHIKTERVQWTTGLGLVNWMVFQVLNRHPKYKMDPSVLEMRTKCQWYPVLPRDREQMVNEVRDRATSNLGSPWHLIELLGDVEDVEEEVEKIKEWLEFQAEMAKAALPDPIPPTGSTGNTPKPRGQASSSSSAEKSVAKRSK